MSQEMTTQQQPQQQAAAMEDESLIAQWQNGAVATITNHTQSNLYLDRHKNWSGIPSLGSFPTSISRGQSANFTHLRKGQFGSIAGVQYSGINADGARCAWILAWQAPVENCPPSPPNRVYVDCGTKSSMDAITWEEIMMKLDNSPDEDYATNSTTKTRADAHIHDSIADAATLGANFRLM